MNVQHILLDDNNAEHRELSIYRTGKLNRVRLQDSSYNIYSSIEIDAHDYAAFFHYGFPEALNQLPFLSESGHGLDSWDEAFLHNSTLPAMNRIIDEHLTSINTEHDEIILLGWQDQPVGVAYLRKIEPARFLAFLKTLRQFVAESEKEGYDMEFIL
ncbi:MAG: hypothetical protein HGA59_01650 [Chlorobiaceae bacterium]|nr:hypothetical protein [Chlorobiaceae bacterium]NTV16712.1 hypothetical protein [Chlorobiaceae bacterium]